MRKENESLPVKRKREEGKKERIVVDELKEMNLRIKEIFEDLERKELTKETAERGCFQAIKETKNFFLLREEDWGKNETRNIWRSIVAWEINSFLNDIQALREKARKKEMFKLQEELELLESEVWAVTHANPPKSILQRIKYALKNISRRRTPLFR